ncbi:hypothetical protein ATCC90586_004004 [Pythium insidiosum]|nr:hypothetical protein ATCC90586_004004 [Pythium insidiosum]
MALWAVAPQLLTGSAANPAVPSPLERDVALDRPLEELLAVPLALEPAAFDQRLQSVFLRCRVLGVGGLFLDSKLSPEDLEDPRDESARLDDAAYCDRVRYVRLVRYRYRAMWTELHREDQEDDAASGSPPVAVDSRDAAALDFQEFVESYATPGQPLVLHGAVGSLADIGISNDELPRFLAACFDLGEGQRALRLDEPQCADEWLQRFRVPLVMAHDYLQRTSVANSHALRPTLVHAAADSHAGVIESFNCPYGLHTLLLPLDLEAQHLDVALHSRRMKPFAYADTTGIREVSVSADTSLESPASTDILRENHYLKTLTPRYTTRLSSRELLFVPGGLFADVSTTGAAQVIRFCYVDASNFNAVKQELAGDALVYDHARQLFRSLHASTFDTSMPRRPAASDALWPSFVTWPKSVKILKRSDVLKGDADTASGDGGLALLSRRERLKIWQDDKRWDRHIESLTLPVPLPPVILNSTRTTVTLRWQDLYQSRKNDITPYGYEIHWAREDENTTTDSESAREGAVNFTSKELVRSAMPTTLFGDEFDGKDIEGVVTGLEADSTYTLSVRVFVGDAMGVASHRSRQVRTKPSTHPEPVRGVPQEVDVADTCLNLRWLRPADDGGRPIVSYLVALKEITDDLEVLTAENPNETSVTERVAVVRALDTAPWQDAKEWITGSVCNLVPGLTFQVRVAAVNSIGVSPWSSRSSPIALTSPAKIRVLSALPVIRGVGDPNYISIPRMDSYRLLDPSLSLVESLQAETRREDIPSSLPRILLSDVQEMIEVNGTLAELREASSVISERDDRDSTTLRAEVWAAHFSPRRFVVSSELVLADPLDASEPLRNAEQVRDRVVLVTRGTVPFVFKIHHAQLAGALGVVIADVNGVCQRTFDQGCVPGANKRNREGFGAQDRHSLWNRIHIPSVLVLQEESQKLLSLLGAQG